MARRRPSHHYYVYVVVLEDTVWNEARFRRANPDYRFDKPCVYVGMTGLDPDLRFDRHKADIQANRYVRDYGLRLLPELYDSIRCPTTARATWKWSWRSACVKRATRYGRRENCQ
jgi:hypothetical protein